MLSLRFSSAVALLLLSLASAQAFCSTSLLQPSLRLRNECSATPMHMAAERRGDGLNLVSSPSPPVHDLCDARY
eukprot:2524030-Rhodomonas_salina.2